MQELTEKAKGEVKGPMKSNNVFKFGDNGMLRSKGKGGRKELDH